MKVCKIVRLIIIVIGISAESITVITRDHDWTREDGEVSHSVCSKMEHPEYNRDARFDKDIAILTLCKPLMFTKGALLLKSSPSF